MSVATNIPRGPTTADLVFILPSKDGSALRVDDSFLSEFAMKEAHSVLITDIRGNEDSFSLEVHAFEALRHVESSTPDEVFADDAIKNVYYPEVSKLLQQHLGVQEVAIQGHGVRRQGKDGQRQPINFVHADHSADVARRMAQEHASQTKKNHLHDERYRIFSVWRPLNGIVESMPMAFVAGDSLDKNDLFLSSIPIRTMSSLDSDLIQDSAGITGPECIIPSAYCSNVPIPEWAYTLQARHLIRLLLM